MPRFNMSSEEATSLVKYFAAVDRAEYPYAYSGRRQTDYLSAADSAYGKKVAGLDAGAGAKQPEAGPSRLVDAMKIVTNGNYCIKCHIVADFVPKGADRAKAPDLSRVYQRLQSDYMRRWIANPKSVLPYTSMPVNVPYDGSAAPYFGGVSQDLYHGTSTEQVDALVDLLMNFDAYAKQHSRVAPLVQQSAPVTPDAAAGATGAGN
jgi:hypothetical protein